MKDAPRAESNPVKDAGHDRPRFSSGALFGARNEIAIVHNGEEYRLRITSNGKLILTK